MKILHTADWHLGRSLRGVSLLEDQAHVLDQIFEVIVASNIDVLIVAGDVYDKASPPEPAVKLYSDFIERVYEETETAIVVIAGNHDSGQRLGAVTKLFDKRRILIRGPLSKDETPLMLEDEHGAVAFSALPYGEIYAARREFEDETIRTPEDVLRNQIEAARDMGASWLKIHLRVVMPHAKPGIASGCTMVFMLTAGALAAPNILGGPSSLWFTQIIYQWYNTGGNWPQGSAYAFVLLVSCIIFVRLMMRIFKVGLGDIAKR